MATHETITLNQTITIFLDGKFVGQIVKMKNYEKSLLKNNGIHFCSLTADIAHELGINENWLKNGLFKVEL